VTVSEWLWRK